MLRRSDSGESDRRLVLLTRELGRIQAIAKGARKSGSRLGPLSEPLMHAQLHLAEGRAFRFVTQIQPMESFSGLRSSYERLCAGLALAELAAHALPEASPNADALDVLLLALRALCEDRAWGPVLVWAESKLMELEGIWPEWAVCCESGEPLRETPAFASPSAGGAISRGFAGNRSDRFEVSVESLLGLAKVVELQAPPTTMKRADECVRTLMRFWEAFLERELPAHRSLLV